MIQAFSVNPRHVIGEPGLTATIAGTSIYPKSTPKRIIIVNGGFEIGETTPWKWLGQNLEESEADAWGAWGRSPNTKAVRDVRGIGNGVTPHAWVQTDYVYFDYPYPIGFRTRYWSRGDSILDDLGAGASRMTANVQFTDDSGRTSPDPDGAVPEGTTDWALRDYTYTSPSMGIKSMRLQFYTQNQSGILYLDDVVTDMIWEPGVGDLNLSATIATSSVELRQGVSDPEQMITINGGFEAGTTTPSNWHGTNLQESDADAWGAFGHAPSTNAVRVVRSIGSGEMAMSWIPNAYVYFEEPYPIGFRTSYWSKGTDILPDAGGAGSSRMTAAVRLTDGSDISTPDPDGAVPEGTTDWALREYTYISPSSKGIKRIRPYFYTKWHSGTLYVDDIVTHIFWGPGVGDPILAATIATSSVEWRHGVSDPDKLSTLNGDFEAGETLPSNWTGYQLEESDALAWGDFGRSPSVKAVRVIRSIGNGATWYAWRPTAYVYFDYPYPIGFKTSYWCKGESVLDDGVGTATSAMTAAMEFSDSSTAWAADPGGAIPNGETDWYFREYTYIAPGPGIKRIWSSFYTFSQSGTLYLDDVETHMIYEHGVGDPNLAATIATSSVDSKSIPPKKMIIINGGLEEGETTPLGWEWGSGEEEETLADAWVGGGIDGSKCVRVVQTVGHSIVIMRPTPRIYFTPPYPLAHTMRYWRKGDNIANDGGIAMSRMAAWMELEDGSLVYRYDPVQSLPLGNSDWALSEYSFTETQGIKFIWPFFHVSWQTGTVYLDDLETHMIWEPGVGDPILAATIAASSVASKSSVGLLELIAAIQSVLGVESKKGVGQPKLIWLVAYPIGYTFPLVEIDIDLSEISLIVDVGD